MITLHLHEEVSVAKSQKMPNTCCIGPANVSMIVR
jgi:hypothetical protein